MVLYDMNREEAREMASKNLLEYSVGKTVNKEATKPAE